MVKVLTFGRMAARTAVSGKTTKSKATASTYGSMVVNMRVRGRTIICMGVECTRGEMAEGTKETMNLIRNLALESTFGLTVGDMKVTGRMVNSMEKGSMCYQMERIRLDIGRMGRG